MARKKQSKSNIVPCSSFATSGGGYEFEKEVIASYVVLLLTNGHVPMFPDYYIEEIRPQTKDLGYSTDDFLIRLSNSKKKVRLLGQIKHTLAVQNGNQAFKESLEGAWIDYNNPDLFTKDTDRILIITDTLNKADYSAVLWLLENSRIIKTPEEYFQKINTTNLTPTGTKKKLEVFRSVLNDIIRNQNENVKTTNPINDYELYQFLQHIAILRYDLLRVESVVLSLLFSHISQINRSGDINGIWTQIKDYTALMNIHAGTINIDSISESIKKYFISSEEAQKQTRQQEQLLLQNYSFESIKKEINMHEIVPALLLGSWDESNPTDAWIVKNIINGDYDTFVENLHDLEQNKNSPFKNTNGIWTVQNPKILLQQFKSQIHELTVKRFAEIAIQIFQNGLLPVQQDNSTPPSEYICKGIATTLAILCSPEITLTKLSPNRINNIVNEIINFYVNANINEWAYIEKYLPLLAEASPYIFLYMLDDNIKSDSSAVVELFTDKSSSIFSAGGIVRSLEILAWSPEHFQLACVILAQLASIDIETPWGRRPINSLRSILMPWHPHTLADNSARTSVLYRIVSEYPDFAWRLLPDLLHGSYVMITDTSRPQYLMTVPEDTPYPSQNDQQAFNRTCEDLIVQLAVDKPSADWKDFLTILPGFDENVFNGFIKNLQDNLRAYSKEEKYCLWETLSQFVNKHRKHSNANWAMSRERTEALEKIVKRLKPKDLLKQYKVLFGVFSYDLVPTKSDLDHDQYIKILEDKQKKAIREIYHEGGIARIIEFAHIVKRPGLVGYYMGFIGDPNTDQYLLTNHLDTKEICEKEFLESYFANRLQATDGKWIDTIDHHDWTIERKVTFLCYMPAYDFTWTIVDQWLGSQKKRYWKQVTIYGYSKFINNQCAVDNLLACQRYDVTLTILWGWMIQKNSNVRIKDVIQTLINLKTWDNEQMYRITDLIEYLQKQPNINMDAMFDIELKYYPDTYINLSYAPIFIEKKLIKQPKLFCKYLTQVFRPDNPDNATKLNEEERITAKKFYRIFDNWLTFPGTNTDGSFSPKIFQSWFKSVYAEAKKIGYTKRIKNVIGSILTKAPADDDGFWIHHTIAKILNQINMKDMREGYYHKKTGVYCWTCSEQFIQEEQKKHDHYIELAKDSKNRRYGYLAELLRSLAAFHQGKISDIRKRLEEDKQQYGE